jgi:hypothetical protein
MRCLSRIEIQEFLDKEVDSSLEAMISDHIEKCEKCSLLYKEAKEDKILINNLLKIDIDEMQSIPEFRLPVIPKERSLLTRIVPLLTAAVLIGFILLFRYDKKPKIEEITEAEMLMYDFYEGKDLNKLWHEKKQILIIKDERDNVIQSIITN